MIVNDKGFSRKSYSLVLGRNNPSKLSLDGDTSHGRRASMLSSDLWSKWEKDMQKELHSNWWLHVYKAQVKDIE